MLISIFLLIIGFVVLIKGADIFVDGASGIATNFKVSKMLIGLTIVSFGTSAPEFAVSVKCQECHSKKRTTNYIINYNTICSIIIR